MKILLILCLALLASSRTYASEEITGTRIQELCTSQSSTDIAYCQGITMGIWQGVYEGAIRVILKLKGPKNFEELYSLRDKYLDVCVPKGVTQGQLIDIFVLYLKNNPDARHLPANILLVRAMLEKYPCR